MVEVSEQPNLRRNHRFFGPSLAHSAGSWPDDSISVDKEGNEIALIDVLGTAVGNNITELCSPDRKTHDQ